MLSGKRMHPFLRDNCSEFSRPFLLAPAAVGRFVRVGHALEGGQQAGLLQAVARCEDDLRFLDLRSVERLHILAAGRTDGEAERTDLAELHDAACLQVLVQGVVHAVHHRFHVGRGQRTALADLLAKLVKAHIAVVHCLRIHLARRFCLVLAQVASFNQFVLLCHVEEL